MKNGQLKPAYNLQLAVQSEYSIGLGLSNPTDTDLDPVFDGLESEYGRLADVLWRMPDMTVKKHGLDRKEEHGMH